MIVAARAHGRWLGPERLARTTVERLRLWLGAFAHAEQPREVDLLDAWHVHGTCAWHVHGMCMACACAEHVRGM